MDESHNIEIIKRDYRPRIIDSRIEQTLSSFGGLLITGPKWCGKSWTGQYYSNSVLYADRDENKKKAVLMPDDLLKGKRPRLIDEWQDIPALWDIARRIIDLERKKGMFVFTGSSVPPRDATSHSGAGRFAKIEMRPLSLYESDDSTGAVSLSGLFEGQAIETVPSAMDYKKAVHLICRGGWPSVVWDYGSCETPREYLESVLDTDIKRAGGKKRRVSRDTMELILKSLARNTATTVKSTTVAQDISNDGKAVSDQTVRAYIGILKSMFLIDEQRPWRPRMRSKSRIRDSPKKHFVDPSLAVAALDGDEDAVRDDPNLAGFLFESLCYRDVCVYSSPFGGKVKYFGDSNNFEIDMIVEAKGAKWGAIEVKLGDDEFDKAAANLIKLKNRVSNEIKPPSFLMILTATGCYAYTRDDGVAVVPVDCLGP